MQRRRLRYAQLREMGILDKNPYAVANEGQNPFPAPKVKPRKGVCPHCNIYIGSGVYMHVMHCEKNHQKGLDWKIRQTLDASRKGQREKMINKARVKKIVQELPDEIEQKFFAPVKFRAQ